MTDWFYPAFRAGGPIRSCVNFIDYFYNDFQIFLLCSDRDAGSEAPLSGIETNQWVNYEGKALVWYAGSGHPDRALLKRIISEIAPDYLYLNSLYSLRFSLLPLWLRRVGVIQTRIIMAPRGMLKKSALSHKPVKKKIFLFLFRLLSFPSIIRFQATDQMELEDIHNHFPHADVMLTPNVPAKIEANDTRIPKVSGSLRLLFVSRVHPIKNLDLVLKALQKVKGHVEFIIIGSVEDQAYWKHCCSLIDQLPAHISVEWKGELPHERIVSVMQQYHLLVLPTKGENFGHVIFEALSAGRPVLISDQTPWRQLAAQHAGWDLSLTEPDAFTDALNAATAWDQNDFDGYIHGAQSLAASYLANAQFKERYFNLFN